MRYKILREYCDICKEKGVEPTISGLNKFDLEKKEKGENNDGKGSKKLTA